ncbi:MAG: hypothetical protein ACREBN_12870, partial [Burkholderiaceae bacterium]
TVIRFAPPLTIARATLDWGIDVFAAVLSEFMPAAEPSDRVSPRAEAVAPRGRRDASTAPTPRVA